MSYGNPLARALGFNAAADTHYAGAAGLLPGSSSFTVLVAVTVNFSAAVASSYFGNTDAAGNVDGWFLGRAGETADGLVGFQMAANYSGGQEATTLQVPASSVLGRTVLLGLTVDDDALATYFQGQRIEVLSGTGAVSPSVEAPGIGNLPAPNSILSASPDYIHAAAYHTGVLSRGNMADIFRIFRETSSLRVAGFEVLGSNFSYSYEFMDIMAPPSNTTPATLPNGGATTGGNFTYQSTTALSFSVDRDPDFGAGSYIPIVP